MEAFMLAGVRTRIGRYGGGLSGVRPDDLAALTISCVVDRAGIAPARRVARHCARLHRDRLCAYGLTAIGTARQPVAAGNADVVVAGGWSR